MIKAYLIRHCETTGQSPEAPLTELGCRQASELSQALAKIGIRRIVSSQYLRAVESAKPLANRCGVTIETDPRLCERKLGDVPGEWLSALAQTFSDDSLAFPGGESSGVATTRAMNCVSEILHSAVGPVAIFTHGNLLSLIARSFDKSLGFEFWRGLKNPDVFEVFEQNGSRGIRRFAL